MNRLITYIWCLVLLVNLARSQALYVPQNATMTIKGFETTGNNSTGLQVYGDLQNEGQVILETEGSLGSTGSLINNSTLTSTGRSEISFLGDLENYGLFSMNSSSSSNFMGQLLNFNRMTLDSAARLNLGFGSEQ